ncbi:hypothetical protein BN873_300090 [Candidatus Competibacter denitrificans Run_A_D11]|uniref:Cyclopropane-fatty-acyl-phospholipid synthase n=1 Tax=Candidatus Competibacter denitrificans Run_A_D11 TaxID=1400863 RepID=W6M775_9GAMM|nr:class I SAM-dependent methyltransferase [Candidatus Competibacter denitrificans]CDI02469.1 hypothetical protein BN873_300090 [Candidatus Competibacter denitrificans Run_A_D11]HRC69769.1 class I SAM-dependent methyltransferase [Candidatus Competibacter denitrificans]
MRHKVIDLLEQGYDVPDWLFRLGIRWSLGRQSPAKAKDADWDCAATRQQDHDVPLGFWQNVLGPRLHYSACWWPKEARDLETAEAAMLSFISERAELGFDQDILDFGCGWGALALWMAEFYPDSRVVAVSDSHAQRVFIAARCRERGFGNVAISTIDAINLFESHRFDRVMLGEGFESMRGYPELGKQLTTWLKPGGKLFLHGITRRQGANPPEDDWLPLFQDGLKLENQWCFDGRHYQRTLNAWLAQQDRQRGTIMALFRDRYGSEQAARRFQRWRRFFMTRAEVFGYRAGQAWAIGHYRFVKP